jgi:hypothetical protein
VAIKPGETLAGPDVGGIAAERLRSIVERIERLEEERKALASDIKDIFAEAKSAGFLSPPRGMLIEQEEEVTSDMLMDSVILWRANPRSAYSRHMVEFRETVS